MYNARTRLLLGDSGIERLAAAHVVVAGLGGVGGYAVEMLARTGIGHLTLIDADCVAPSNLNRQIIALRSTVGQPKSELFEQRVADINPDIKVTAINEFLTPENVADLIPADADYVIDAIDTVAPKVELIVLCLQRRQRIISSMGAGGRTDVTQICYRDLWQTEEDGLARVVRQRLKKRGLKRSLRVVCSTEKPRAGSIIELNEQNKRSSFGTTAIVPSTFGIYLAAHVIQYITQK